LRDLTAAAGIPATRIRMLVVAGISVVVALLLRRRFTN
jgi:hypothetical protein